jgi:hypothetical protein
MINYGNSVAKYVIQGKVNIGTGAWTPLQVGSTPQKSRNMLRISSRANTGLTCALAYANIDIDGNFTTPTTTVAETTIVPGGRTWTEPVGDKVQVYGRLLLKAGATDTSAKLIVTEFC